MTTSFYNGIIGVQSHQKGINIISDNISNISSTAFKSIRPEFSTIFSTTLNGGYNNSSYSDIGLGSSVNSDSVNLSQGSLTPTDRTFDMAIDGKGWFGVKKSDGEKYYTRNGDFSIDSDGDLVNTNGLYLLGTLGGNITPTTLPKDKLDIFGKQYSNKEITDLSPYSISETNNIKLSSVDTQSKINLPYLLYLPPKPTQNIKYKANLDPTIKTTTDPSTGATVEIPNVEHFTTSLISPAGKKNILDMTFTKRVPSQVSGSTWDANVQIQQFYEAYDPTKTYDPTIYKVDKDADKVYNIIDNKNGVLSFDGDGALLSNTIPTLSNSGTPLTLNLGTVLNPTDPNSGYDGLMSLKNNSFSSSVQADGQVEGYLTKYDVVNNGEVVADFDNGQSVPIAKIGVYHFQNAQGLEMSGDSLYKESSNSGKPIFFQNSSGEYVNNSKIQSHKLEQSNVSFSTALTELIMMQKAYDASAKSITTSDQMIQKAINMKT
jgi:flagellar hook-basal body protein